MRSQTALNVRDLAPVLALVCPVLVPAHNKAGQAVFFKEPGSFSLLKTIWVWPAISQKRGQIFFSAPAAPGYCEYSVGPCKTLVYGIFGPFLDMLYDF